MFCLDNISFKFKNGLCGPTSKLLGQISLKSSVHCRGHSFDTVFMKRIEIVDFDDILLKLKKQNMSY